MWFELNAFSMVMVDGHVWILCKHGSRIAQCCCLQTLEQLSTSLISILNNWLAGVTIEEEARPCWAEDNSSDNANFVVQGKYKSLKTSRHTCWIANRWRHFNMLVGTGTFITWFREEGALAGGIFAVFKGNRYWTTQFPTNGSMALDILVDQIEYWRL